ncbi:alcohol dehydrogenase [Fusarium oxysporum f. sp. melonis 26406]|uniref:Alcohol dehydrogenase n=1 Tax=Fusarium oxysporum f. sp. melonis 26406 TaxID=1089452 RepID=X0AAM3_FUSOX|nr:alcohol dehydrogenase [Fusarium oxysporum f. sp. melonis 26406]KAJ9417164.1 alcohol dehydrogenase [Fusarium oxysporum]
MSVKTAPRVSLGKNGPLVSRMGLGLGLGTMGLTRPTYGAIPIQGEIFAFLDHAYEAGVTFWDSADYYNDCEEIIGKWFRRTGKRGDIFLATKFGYVKNSQTFELNTSYVYVKKACAESLRLLDIESIDLSYLHIPNPETPIEETMRALKELQDEGKIKCIGLSAVTSTTLCRAAKIAPVAAIQIGYSAFGLYCEGEKGTHILDTCRELDLAIVAAMPLGRGLLTANFIDGTASGQQDSDFKGLADKKGIITARLAIAWLLKQGDDIIPIPGTKRIQYFEENWAALDIVLSGEEEAEIRKFVEKADIASVPLPPALDGWLFRDTKEESV